MEWHGKFMGLVTKRSPGMARAMRWAAEQVTKATLGDIQAYFEEGSEERDPENAQDDLERWSAALKNPLVQGRRICCAERGRGEQWFRDFAADLQEVRPEDPDPSDATHGAGDGAWEVAQERGHRDGLRQMGGQTRRTGAGLPGESQREDADRYYYVHGVRRPPGDAPPAGGTFHGVPPCSRKGHDVGGHEDEAQGPQRHGCGQVSGNHWGHAVELAYGVENSERNGFGEDSGYEKYSCVESSGKGATQCYRCMGFGHMAAQCATPKGMSKGGGKDSGKRSVKVEGHWQGQDSSSLPRLWQARPWARQLLDPPPGALAEGRQQHRDGGGDARERRVGCEPASRWNPSARAGAEVRQDFTVPRTRQAPELFEVLCESGDTWDIGSLAEGGRGRDAGGQEEAESCVVGSLDVVSPSVDRVAKDQTPGSKAKLKSAGRGRITIDSGAAESVLPAGLLPGEALREGNAKKAGVTYMAACGTAMQNHGEKRVRFKTVEADGTRSSMAAIQFQVTDANKPLASVSRILDQGNSMLLTRDGTGSCSINGATGERIPIREEKPSFFAGR